MAARTKRKGGKAIPRAPKRTFTLQKAAKGKAARPCPGNLPRMCRDLNEWAKEWERWGERVRLVLNCVVDQCCTACDPGDPDPVPPPPKPPFA